MNSKVVGIGLNKTATKSLAQCLGAVGYDNHSYSLSAFNLYQQQDWPALFALMDKYSSFEDWPWPLMFRQIEQQYPEAKFILTTRANPEVWYKSLCKMAVRMGPLTEFEQHIYGYSMPQGHRKEHIDFYNNHNQQVRDYFSDKPGKLLEICFDHGVEMKNICDFLDQPVVDFTPPHANKSAKVYSGDSLFKAQLNRVYFQSSWHTRQWLRQRKKQLLAILN